MGTSLAFHEEGRAAKMALALQAEGFGVMWYPDDKPQIVMTSASREEVREVSSKTKGVVYEWSRLARIDCGCS